MASTIEVGQKGHIFGAAYTSTVQDFQEFCITTYAERAQNNVGARNFVQAVVDHRLTVRQLPYFMG